MKKLEPTFTRACLVLCCCSAIIIQIHAQQVMLNCGSDALREQLAIHRPDIIEKQNTEDARTYRNLAQPWMNYIQNIGHPAPSAFMPPQPCVAGTPVYKIPVVVHVVYDAAVPASNISDATVQLAIQRLNEGFRNINSFAGNGHNSNPLVASQDIQFEFYLAQRDLNGSTMYFPGANGITRRANPISTNFAGAVSWPADSSLKALVQNATAGAFATTDYMNIYIVNSFSQYAGYAYFASAHGSFFDGLSIPRSNFGLAQPYTDVTVIHEAGHYFNLYHTFEGGCTATNNNCLLDGDHVCDTPPDNSSTGVNCGNAQNTCSNDHTQTNSPFTSNQDDLYEDYMDYANWQCQNTFTQGQKDRMWDALLNIRTSLLTSEGMIPANIKDVTLADVLTPAQNAWVCATTSPLIVRIKNSGTVSITSVTVSVSLNGATQYTQTFSASIAAGQYANLTLTPLTGIVDGTNQLYVNITETNGAAETYTDNDKLCRQFDYFSAGFDYSACENLEDGTLDPNWKLQTTSPASDSLAYITSLAVCSSTKALKLNTFGSWNIEDTVYVLSKQLSIPASAGTAKFYFSRAYPREFYSNCYSKLILQISTNCGQTYSTIWSRASGSLHSYSGQPTTAWTPSTCAHWANDSVSLLSYAGQTVILRFKAYAENPNNIASYSWGNNLYLDNFCTTIVSPTCTATISPVSSTICNGASATLTASAGSSYLWSNSLGSTAAVTVSPASTTTYTVTVTQANLCTASASRTVTVNAAPTASIAPATVAICAGASTTLTASGGGTYAWSHSLGSAATVSVTPVSATTYTVTVTNANNCTATASRLVTVNAVPNAGISPATAAVCSGASVTLTASGGTSYAWSNSLGSNAAVTVTPASTTTYTVTVTNANSCTATASRTVTIGNTPNAGISPASPTICSGTSRTLTASGGGTYAWSNALGSTAAVTVSPASTTTYTVTVTDVSTCTATATAVVNVNTSPTANINPSTITICSGTSTTLTATGGGTYAWSNSLGSAAAVSVSPVSTNTYTVTVTSANSCTASASASVIVNQQQNQTVDIAITAGTSSICTGASVTFTATAANVGSSPVYRWKKNGVTVGNNATTYTAANFANGDSVWVVLTSNSACTSVMTDTSNKIYITVLPAVVPSVTISPAPNDSICSGTSVTFTVNAVNAGANPSYQWRKNNVDVFGATQSTYTTDSLINNNTIRVNLTSGAQCASPASVLSPQITMKVFATPQQPVGSVNSPVCEGEAINLSCVAVNGVTYLWTGPNGFTAATRTASISSAALNNAGEYYISVTKTECTSIADTVSVVVNPIPAAPVITQTGNILSSDAPANNQWYRNGVLINGEVNPSYSPVQSGNYFVILNAAGCKSDTSNIINFIVSGTDDLAKTYFNLYPNPANGSEIYVLMSGNTKDVSLRITDMAGRQVVQPQPAHAGANTINIEGLNSGMYIVEVKTGKQLRAERLVIGR